MIKTVKEETVFVFVNVGIANVTLDTSSYLTVMHSVTEETVQQQVLQLSVPVKRLFDLTQEDTGGRGDACVSKQH